jgi:nucleoid DNA-binding protein
VPASVSHASAIPTAFLEGNACAAASAFDPSPVRVRPARVAIPAPRRAARARAVRFSSGGSGRRCGKTRLFLARMPRESVLVFRPAALLRQKYGEFGMAKAKAKAKATKGAPTKGQMFATIAEHTDLSKRQVSAVFEALNGIVTKSLKSNGVVTLPGLAKMKVVKKPATKAREGVNPFTGEKMMFKAKPASKKVRILPVKALKDAVN